MMIKLRLLRWVWVAQDLVYSVWPAISHKTLTIDTINQSLKIRQQQSSRFSFVLIERNFPFKLFENFPSRKADKKFFIAFFIILQDIIRGWLSSSFFIFSSLKRSLKSFLSLLERIFIIYFHVNIGHDFLLDFICALKSFMVANFWEV